MLWLLEPMGLPHQQYVSWVVSSSVASTSCGICTYPGATAKWPTSLKPTLMSRTVCDKPPLRLFLEHSRKPQREGSNTASRHRTGAWVLSSSPSPTWEGGQGSQTTTPPTAALPTFPSHSTVWSWPPPTVLLRSSIANLLPRSWHTGPRPSNTLEMGRKHSQRFIFNPDSELLCSKFQRTRGSWGQDTRAVTAACSLTASAPRTGRQRNSTDNWNHQGNFWNRIPYLTLEHGQGVRAEPSVSANIP